MFDSFIKTSSKETKSLDTAAIAQWLHNDVERQFFVGEHPCRITIWNAVPALTSEGKLCRNPRQSTTLFVKSGWDKTQMHMFNMKTLDVLSKNIEEVKTKLTSYFDWLEKNFELVEDSKLKRVDVCMALDN